jgi:hypothetical protein
MKSKILGIYSVLLLTFAVFGMGCESNHRHGVGLELEIHSKDHADHKDRDHKDDHHDDNHNDHGGEQDDNR